MYRLLIILMLGVFFPAAAWTQEAVEDSAATAAAEDPEPESELEVDEPEEPDIDETGLDEQGFSDEDDDFRPSEEIPADQSIEFPTDI